MEQTNNTQYIKNTLTAVIRLLIYGLAVLLLAELLRYDAGTALRDEKFSEHSWTEKIQSVMLLFSSSIFLYCFCKIRKFSMLSLFLLSFTVASLVREQDLFLDEWLFHGAWKLGSFGVVLFSLVIISKNINAFGKQVSEFSRSFVFGLMMNGFLTTYVFSRLFGRKIFWILVMGDRYFRDVKNAGEECVELYGYLLFLIAAAEYLLYTLSSFKSTVLSPLNLHHERNLSPVMNALKEKQTNHENHLSTIKDVES